MELSLLLSPIGDKPGWAGDEIFVSLRSCVRMTSFGRAVSDNNGFLASLPHRKSFSPDAAFYPGWLGGMKYFPDVPVFAAEIRSEHNYGPNAELEMARKRADYFAAGCRVVWDVDLPVNSRRFTGTALLPMQNPPCQAGRWR